MNKSLNPLVTGVNSGLKDFAKSARSSADALDKFTKNKNAMKGVADQIKKVNIVAEDSTDTVERFGRQANLAIRRYGAFTLVTGAFIQLTQAITNSTRNAIEFDREIVRVAQVTGSTVSGLKPLTDEINRLSAGLGTSSKDLVNVSVTLAQAGLTAEETRQALEALAKTSVSATFGNMGDTTEAAIAIMQQFNIEAKDLEKALGSINRVSAVFAVVS